MYSSPPDNEELLFIDEVSTMPYEMLAMIDARSRQLKGNDVECFEGTHVALLGGLFRFYFFSFYHITVQLKIYTLF